MGQGERKRERNIDVQEIHQSVASHMPPTGDVVHNPNMCPDWELNQWPFGLWPVVSPLRHTSKGPFYLFIFLRFYLFIFRERGREGEREGEKHQCRAASHLAPTGDLAWNPGICPDWELNQQPFGFAGQHSIYWATQARAISPIFKYIVQWS